MKNKIIFGLVFLFTYGVQVAYAAMIGIAEIILLIVIGILFLGFFCGIFMLIYFLI